MDIKQILKEKIENCEKEEKYGDVFHHEIWYAKADTYRDCANLIEQSEKPMKVGEPRDCVNELDKKTYNQKMYLCPNCSRVVAPFLVTDYDKICFCPYCGQHLDWGEGEKK